MRERLRAAVLLLLLSGLVAVLAVRAVRLASRPEELDALDERKWFRSAGPVAGAAATFAAARSGLPPAGEVWLALPPGWDPVWWGWMGRYHLPEQRIAGVLQPEAEAPAGAWIVAVAPEGRATVQRARRAR